MESSTMPGSWRRPACTLVWIAALAIVLAAALPQTGSAAQVTYLVRPVEVKRVGTRQWVPLNVGEEVVEGDSLRTGRGGRVEVTIAPKRVFRVGEASEITLDGMVLRDADLVGKFRVILGRLWTSMLDPLRASRGESVVVETPTVSMGIKGTRFDVAYDQHTRGVETLVLEGVVEANPTQRPPGPPKEIEGPREVAPPQEITREEWTLLVHANQKLVYVPGQPPKVVPITADEMTSDWVKFNQSRDATLR